MTTLLLWPSTSGSTGSTRFCLLQSSWVSACSSDITVALRQWGAADPVNPEQMAVHESFLSAPRSLSHVHVALHLCDSMHTCTAESVQMPVEAT